MGLFDGIKKALNLQPQGEPALGGPDTAPASSGPFVADSFSFGVEREMKESGEKGGTEDINIGVGELQEMTISKGMDSASPGVAEAASEDLNFDEAGADTIPPAYQGPDLSGFFPPSEEGQPEETSQPGSGGGGTEASAMGEEGTSAAMGPGFQPGAPYYSPLEGPEDISSDAQEESLAPPYTGPDIHILSGQPPDGSTPPPAEAESISFNFEKIKVEYNESESPPSEGLDDLSQKVEPSDPEAMSDIYLKIAEVEGEVESPPLEGQDDLSQKVQPGAQGATPEEPAYGGPDTVPAAGDSLPAESISFNYVKMEPPSSQGGGSGFGDYMDDDLPAGDGSVKPGDFQAEGADPEAYFKVELEDVLISSVQPGALEGDAAPGSEAGIQDLMMKEDAGQEEYLKVELKDALISSYQSSGDADDRPTEELGLNYQKISYEEIAMPDAAEDSSGEDPGADDAGTDGGEPQEARSLSDIPLTTTYDKSSPKMDEADEAEGIAPDTGDSDFQAAAGESSLDEGSMPAETLSLNFEKINPGAGPGDTELPAIQNPTDNLYESPGGEAGIQDLMMKESAGKEEYLELKMENVLISSYQTGGSEGDEQPDGPADETQGTEPAAPMGAADAWPAKLEIGALKAGSSDVLDEEDDGPSTLLGDVGASGEMTKLGYAADLEPDAAEFDGGVEHEDSWEEQT